MKQKAKSNLEGDSKESPNIRLGFALIFLELTHQLIGFIYVCRTIHLRKVYAPQFGPVNPPGHVDHDGVTGITVAFSSVVAASIVVVITVVASDTIVDVASVVAVVLCIVDKTSVVGGAISGVAVTASLVIGVSIEVVACIKFMVFVVVAVVPAVVISESVGVVEASIEFVIMTSADLVVNTVVNRTSVVGTNPSVVAVAVTVEAAVSSVVLGSPKDNVVASVAVGVSEGVPVAKALITVIVVFIVEAKSSSVVENSVGDSATGVVIIRGSTKRVFPSEFVAKILISDSGEMSIE